VPTDDSTSFPTAIIGGVIGGFAFLLLVSISISFLIVRSRKKKASTELQMTDIKAVESLSRSNTHSSIYSAFTKQGSNYNPSTSAEDSTDFSFNISIKEDSIYKEFIPMANYKAKESIPSKEIQLEHEIGRGSYGMLLITTNL
jgi:hypothetical protein